MHFWWTRDDSVLRQEERTSTRRCQSAAGKLHDSDQRGNKAWGRWGVGISQMRVLPCALYVGETFDSNVAVMCPNDQSFVLPIWMYCRSEEYHDNVRRIDQKLNITNATLAKIPFDLDRWTGCRPGTISQRPPPSLLRRSHPMDFPRPPLRVGGLGRSWRKRTAHGPLRTDDTVLQDRCRPPARLPLAGRTAMPAWSWPTSNANGFGIARHCMPSRIKPVSSASRRYGVSRPPGNGCFNY